MSRDLELGEGLAWELVVGSTEYWYRYLEVNSSTFP